MPDISIDAVAERLGLSRRSVERLREKGELVMHKHGRIYRVSEEALQDYRERSIYKPPVYQSSFQVPKIKRCSPSGGAKGGGYYPGMKVV